MAGAGRSGGGAKAGGGRTTGGGGGNNGGTKHGLERTTRNDPAAGVVATSCTNTRPSGARIVSVNTVLGGRLVKMKLPPASSRAV